MSKGIGKQELDPELTAEIESGGANLDDLFGIISKTMFIDSVNGSDATGDGSTIKPYKTFKHAFSTLPKFSYAVTFRLMSGTYDLNTEPYNLNKPEDPSTYKYFKSLSIRGDTTTPANVNITGLSLLNAIPMHTIDMSGFTLDNMISLSFEVPVVKVSKVELKTGRLSPLMATGLFGGEFYVNDITVNNLTNDAVFQTLGGLWHFSNIKGTGNWCPYVANNSIIILGAGNTMTGTAGKVVKVNGGQLFE